MEGSIDFFRDEFEGTIRRPKLEKRGYRVVRVAVSDKVFAFIGVVKVERHVRVYSHGIFNPSIYFPANFFHSPHR